MIVCVTGGIGSGKSMVSNVFELLGCAVFNSDTVAKSVYFEKEIKTKVIELLGEEAYLNDHQLNKTHINSKLFSNTEVLHKLNAIIHPAVIEQFNAFVQGSKSKIIIKETALLFEAHLDKGCDKIIVVAADDELRISRVMKRDGLSKEEVINKMKHQLSQEEKIKKADYVVYNNEDSLLIPQIIEIHQALLLY